MGFLKHFYNDIKTFIYSAKIAFYDTNHRAVMEDRNYWYFNKRKWIFYYHFNGWDNISFGFHVCLSAPNIEVHLPFGFIRAGKEVENFTINQHNKENMMNNLKCDNCGKELRPEMEIERSHYLGEYYCEPDCAMDRYFNYLESLPLTDEEKSELFKTPGVVAGDNS